MKNIIQKLGSKVAYVLVGIALAVAGGVVYAANVTVPQAPQKGAWLSGLATGNYQTNVPCSNGLVLVASSTTATGWACASTSGSSGLTSFAGMTGPAITVATTSDTNLQLQIITSGNNATFTPVWIGTLAAGRLNSNVVQGVTNDTNVTGSIAAQNLTLGWSGQLSVARGGTGTNTLASLTVGSNLSITGGQNVLIGTSTQISLGANVVTTLATGTTGNIFNGSISSNTLTLNLPFASGSNTGQLQSGDWTTFNNKLTTVTADSPLGGSGTSGSHLTCTGCLTGNQTITLSGDVTGSGATAITTTYNNVVPANKGGTGTSTAPTQQGQILIADNTGVKYAPGTHVNTATFSWGTSTPLQLSGNVLQVPNSITFNNSGSGAASGQTFNGSSAQTISYNTIGAQVAGTYLGNSNVSGVSGQNAFFAGTNTVNGSVNYLWDNTARALLINTTTPAQANFQVTASTTQTTDIFRVSSTTGLALLKVTGLGNVNIATITASSLVMTDASKNLAPVTLGTNLSFSGNTLNASGSGGSGNSAWTIGSSLIYNATTTDSVLIGTTTPTSSKLFIQGTGTQTLLSVATSTGISVFTIQNSGDILIQEAATSTTSFLMKNPSAQTIFQIDSTATLPGLNVGASQGTQIATLYVQGSTASSTAPLLAVASSTATSYFTVTASGQILTQSITPTISTSTGIAATSNTCRSAQNTCSATLSNADNTSGYITFMTGHAPAANATILTVTFPVAWANAPNCVLSSATTAPASSFNVYSTTTATTLALKVGSTALIGTSTFAIYYHCFSH